MCSLTVSTLSVITFSKFAISAATRSAARPARARYPLAHIGQCIHRAFDGSLQRFDQPRLDLSRASAAASAFAANAPFDDVLHDGDLQRQAFRGARQVRDRPRALDPLAALLAMAAARRPISALALSGLRVPSDRCAASSTMLTDFVSWSPRAAVTRSRRCDTASSRSKPDRRHAGAARRWLPASRYRRNGGDCPSPRSAALAGVRGRPCLRRAAANWSPAI